MDPGPTGPAWCRPSTSSPATGRATASTCSTSTTTRRPRGCGSARKAASHDPPSARRGAPSEDQGQFSPDGHWILYTSAESGRREVYVRRFPEGTSKTQVSIAGGDNFCWRGDGGEIYFVSPDRQLMAVPWKPRARDADPPSTGAVPRLPVPGRTGPQLRRDARRPAVLMVTPPADEPPSVITVAIERGLEPVK
jgi:hypothetical protein